MITLPLPKPIFGHPCNGCGVCCTTELCVVGQLAFGLDTPAPCPGLVVENGRGWCWFVMAEKTTTPDNPMIQRMLGIGKGCTMDDPKGEQ